MAEAKSIGRLMDLDVVTLVTNLELLMKRMIKNVSSKLQFMFDTIVRLGTTFPFTDKTFNLAL